MKKILVMMTFMWSSFVFANSTIDIPVPNNGLVEPKGSVLNLTIEGYAIPSIEYQVTCKINAPIDVLVFIGAGSGSVGIAVNGVNKPGRGNTQTTLPAGDNTVSFSGLFHNPYSSAEAARFCFKNLDNMASIMVSNCTANPIVS